MTQLAKDGTVARFALSLDRFVALRGWRDNAEDDQLDWLAEPVADSAVSPRAGCFWLELRLGFPNQLRSDSTCWLGGGQQGCRSLIRKTCVIG